MKTKTLLLSAFILVALVQLFVPIQMISSQAGYANKGTEFKFKTANRYNPDFIGISSDLSGKFIPLWFKENHVKITDKQYWEKIHNAYVIFTTDSNGFAKIRSVTTMKPVDTNDWVWTNVWVNRKDSTKLQISYPFSNYYFRDIENKKVESVIKNGLCDTLKTNFLKIKIKENQFVIGDLIIDNVSFKEMIGEPKKSK